MSVRAGIFCLGLVAAWLTGVRGVGHAAESGATKHPWPFTELREPTVPPVKRKDWVRNPIDAFVLARMEQKGLEPAPPVPDRVLLRRLYFDLIGLPPTPEEVAAFESESIRNPGYPPGAEIRNSIDRLLEDSRYGERWGRHWLDLVRYADSGGGGLDFPLPHMWRYRDYVIRAFNQDRPYDRFIREQIAGDAFSVYGDEGKIGAGFLRLGVFVEGTRKEMRRDLLNDIVGTTGSVFLGLTIGCARCHDHKFDQVPTRDYYRLEAFFAPVTVQPAAVPFTQYESSAAIEQKKKQHEEALAKRKEYIDKIKAEYKARVREAMGVSLAAPQDLKDTAAPIDDGDVARAMSKGVLFTKEERELYRKLNRMQLGADRHLDVYEPKAYTATELLGASNSPEPNYPIAPTTYVLEGGDPKQKGEAVKPGFLAAVTGHAKPVDLQGVQDSRRKFLADWIASPDNPLTARVMVNRIWQHHFGEGLVPTPSDFGQNGGGTVHSDLIDWLAVQFIKSGWSVKAMHRLMLSSNLYRQSMVNPRAKDFEKIDADGRFLWRRKPIRLEAETIRDSILSVSGELNLAAGGPGFFPEVDDVLMERADTWWEPSAQKQRNRRSVYMLQKRALVHPLVRVFDGANINETCAARAVTTVTPQVFALLNSKFVHQQSQALAARIVRQAGDDPDAQIDRAFRLAFQRPPTTMETTQCREFLRKWTLPDVCLVIMNMNEFVFLE